MIKEIIGHDIPEFYSENLGDDSLQLVIDAHVEEFKNKAIEMGFSELLGDAWLTGLPEEGLPRHFLIQNIFEEGHSSLEEHLIELPQTLEQLLETCLSIHKLYRAVKDTVEQGPSNTYEEFLRVFMKEPTIMMVPIVFSDEKSYF